MKIIPILWYLVPFSGLIALITARLFYVGVSRESEGTDKMKEIAGYVREGAMAYLRRQYKIIVYVFLAIFLLLFGMVFAGIQNVFVPFIFLSGGLWSGVCGYLGMKTATNASARTANACQTSLNKGLKISFRAGAVMGLVVVGFGLLDISIWFLLLNYFFDHNILGISNAFLSDIGVTSWRSEYANLDLFRSFKFVELTTSLLPYGMGASIMALFSRVGGGIFTKAADVGADMVGKVQAGIPEDDPRNPATIADNVGDNVGDVAGMGADLYESYCGSIIACASLGATMMVARFITGDGLDIRPVIAPMVVAAGGIIFSIIGIFVVKTKEDADQKKLLGALHTGTNVSGALMILFVSFLAMQGLITWGIFGALISGLVSGVLIGQVTEYYTSDHYTPTRSIADNAKMGGSTAIIQGISVGMLSTGFTVLIISLGIILAYLFSGGAGSMVQGIYGIAFAAIGMLSTLGITLATDAFGPIADNAGGNAEMSGLDPVVRSRTDALDSLGNTTAATGKGFAIGSAALTALALIAAYIDSIKVWLGRIAGDGVHFVGSIGFSNREDLTQSSSVYFIDTLDIHQLVQIFQINVINPKFLIGIFLGAMTAFVFCAFTILAVGRSAGAMVEEVQRQFNEIDGILERKRVPEYAKCVDIATLSAQKEMVIPSLLALFVPLVTGFFLSIAGMLGLLIGCVATGFSLAIMLNNSGGAWDNAKKFIEKGAHGGKGTEAHKASVIGDTVGDPFKDTAGPSLNILLKLMAIVSVVFVGLILKFGIILF